MSTWNGFIPAHKVIRYRIGRVKWIWGGLLLLFILTAALTLGCESLSIISEPEQEQLPFSPFTLPDPLPSPPEAEEVRLGFLYYSDGQYRFLVPVRRAIPWVEGIAKNTLLHLASSPDSTAELQEMGLSAILPRQTTIHGIAINDGLARVDFSSDFLSYPPERERLVLGSILCTLRQFSTIDTVEILVEGENIDRFPGGAPGRLPLGPECYINLELDETVEDYRNFAAVKLFYCYPAPNGRILYVPVTRILPSTEDVQTAAVVELLEGPRKGSGLFSDIPPGTELHSYTLVDGLAVLDFSDAFLAYQGGRTGAENMVNQILLTLFELEGVDQVQILAEGAVVTLEGLDLTNPLTPPEVYNYF